MENLLGYRFIEVITWKVQNLQTLATSYTWRNNSFQIVSWKSKVRQPSQIAFGGWARFDLTIYFPPNPDIKVGLIPIEKGMTLEKGFSSIVNIDH